MRLFQNSALAPSYVARLNELASHAVSFEDRRAVFLNDRFGALHFLQPVLKGDPDAFFTNGNDDVLQRQWARQNGMRNESSLDTILYAQIEHHQTEVFYNLDPVRYPSMFVGKLPGCVRKTLCWRAAPSGQADLTAYGAVIGNFPSILNSWRRKGCRAELFYPAIDPVMSEFGYGERSIDVLFVGGYSRHHASRARVLEHVARVAGNRSLVYCLDASRLTRLAESPIGRFLPLRKHRRPDEVSKIAKPPIFGRQLYELIGKSKIVLNGAIDMAGRDRGNMRCFEAMGCGALLVSDAGNYPDGMVPNETIATYDTAENAAEKIQELLSHWASTRKMAEDGQRLIENLYTKAHQWSLFQKILARL